MAAFYSLAFVATIAFTWRTIYVPIGSLGIFAICLAFQSARYQEDLANLELDDSNSRSFWKDGDLAAESFRNAAPISDACALFATMISMPHACLSRIVERVSPMTRALNVETTATFEFKHVQNATDLHIPVLCPRKGVLFDDLKMLIDGSPVVSVSHDESVELALTALEEIARSCGALDRYKLECKPRVTEVVSRHADRRNKNDEEFARRQAELAAAQVYSALTADGVGSLTGSDAANRNSLAAIAEKMVRVLSANYPILVRVPEYRAPSLAGGTRELSDDDEAKDESAAAMVHDSSPSPSKRTQISDSGNVYFVCTYSYRLLQSRKRGRELDGAIEAATKSLSGLMTTIKSVFDAIRWFAGARSSTFYYPLRGASHSQSYHLEFMGPPGTYLAKQEILGIHTQNVRYIRVRRRMGQRYSHLYIRRLNIVSLDESPQMKLKFLERQPGTVSAAALASIGSLVSLVCAYISRVDHSNFGGDLSVLMLALPAAASGWMEASRRTSLSATLAAIATNLAVFILSVTALVLLFLTPDSCLPSGLDIAWRCLLTLSGWVAILATLAWIRRSRLEYLVSSRERLDAYALDLIGK